MAKILVTVFLAILFAPILSAETPPETIAWRVPLSVRVWRISIENVAGTPTDGIVRDR